ncbi:MAG: Uma2 family endonuclease [Gammaproteobacteria bacterium]
MSMVKAARRLSIADYLAQERDGEARHEYIDGEIFAMTGASRAHNFIAGNLFSAIHLHLRNTPCRVFMNDMKVRIGNRFYYPDLLVSCTKVADEPDEYYETAPKLIIEVLSDSTEIDDKKHKRLAYQQLPSLQEYALIGQKPPQVEIYRRQAEGWIIETFTEDDAVRFQSIDLTVPILDIYRNVV